MMFRNLRFAILGSWREFRQQQSIGWRNNPHSGCQQTFKQDQQILVASHQPVCSCRQRSMDKLVIIRIAAKNLTGDLLRNIDPIGNGINIVQELLPIFHCHIAVELG